MKKYTLRINRRANQDVDAIVDWIGNRRQSPNGASRWLEAYENAVRSLAEAAPSCGLAPENNIVERDVRQILFSTRQGSTYRVVFTIHAHEVLILRVRGPGQPPLEEDELE